MPWAAIIPAVASLAGTAIGGIMSSNSASADRDAQFVTNQANYEHQKEFAQHGITWKTQDAQRAGIHPLFALGAQTNPFSGSSFTPVGDRTGDLVSRGLSAAGQDLGRAYAATQTKQERNNGITSALALERQQLENDLLRSQIARNLAGSQIGPGFPRAGGGMTGDVNSPALGPAKMEPTEVGTAAPGSPGLASGPYNPQVRFGVSPDGRGFQSFPAKGLFSDEDVTSPMFLDWYIRNRMLPNVSSGGRGPTPDQAAAMFKGAIGAEWSHSEQRWVPIYPDARRTGRYIGSSASRPGVRSGLHYLETMRGR